MKTAYLIIPMLMLLAACSSVVVERGNHVFVTYTGAYENGTVFDSNDPAVPNAHAGPLLVKLGQNEVISGFENALLGMKQGESKTVTIKALDAYGAYKAELVQQIPAYVLVERDLKIKRNQHLTLAQLKGADLSKDTYDTINFRYNIVNRTPDGADVYMAEPLRDPIVINEYPWNSTRIKTTPEYFVYRNNVVDGAIYRTPSGPYVASVNETQITLKTTLLLGNVVRSGGVQGRITKETSDRLTIDFNHLLAGENLVFTIKIETIEQKQ